MTEEMHVKIENKAEEKSEKSDWWAIPRLFLSIVVGLIASDVVEESRLIPNWRLFPASQREGFWAKFKDNLGDMKPQFAFLAGIIAAVGTWHTAKVIQNSLKYEVQEIKRYKDEKTALKIAIAEEEQATTKHRDRVLEAAGARNSPMGNDYIQSHSR